MKNRILFGTMLALLLVGSVSFADDDADKKRLLEEYDRMQAEKAKEAERLAKEQPQAVEATEQASPAEVPQEAAPAEALVEQAK